MVGLIPIGPWSYPDAARGAEDDGIVLDAGGGARPHHAAIVFFFFVAVIAVVSQPTCACGVGAVPHLSTGTQDEQLRAMVKQQGARRWKIIAAALPNKSAIQCMHRWQKVHP